MSRVTQQSEACAEESATASDELTSFATSIQNSLHKLTKLVGVELESAGDLVNSVAAFTHAGDFPMTPCEESTHSLHVSEVKRFR